MPHVDFSQTFCRGAIARRDITPPVGCYHRMWGAATHDRSTGIHRPLLATALALESSTDTRGAGARPVRQVIVSLDHCLLWNEEMDALRSAVCSSAGLADAELHVTFSHTHAAGLMDPARADLPGGDLIAPYLNQMAALAGEAAAEALASIRPLRIVYGHGRCALARHRDFWDADNRLFVCGFNPAGPSDDTLLVARFTDERSHTVATLVNYACHPTTLAWDNTLVSPDFVGAMRELVESATAAPCLFLQGASGELGPRDGYVGDVAVADRNGRELGYAALAALESLPPPGLRFAYRGPVLSGATIGTWEYIPLEPESLCEKHRWRCDRFDVALPYRSDLPTRDQTESQLAHWQAEEQAARSRRRRAGPRCASPGRAHGPPTGPAAVAPLGRVGPAYGFAVATGRRDLGHASGGALQLFTAGVARAVCRLPNRRRNGHRRLAPRLSAHRRHLRQGYLPGVDRHRGPRITGIPRRHDRPAHRRLARLTGSRKMGLAPSREVPVPFFNEQPTRATARSASNPPRPLPLDGAL
jgi:hypothetical protein